ncbi:hypothetical protein BV20DRAFT_974084 [Pilatotrama ljubarskyi]|nr:hypothetical protein BV20DRAFT_974084 [Pilatotrama ljubarskyi]
MDTGTSGSHGSDYIRGHTRNTVMQAATEGLLDLETLSLAQADPAFTFLALHLYVAAVCSATYPPSIQIPAARPHASDSTDETTQPTSLSEHNCSALIRPSILNWSDLVPHVQALPRPCQRDLARITCGLPPQVYPVNACLVAIADGLRSVARDILESGASLTAFGSDCQPEEPIVSSKLGCIVGSTSIAQDQRREEAEVHKTRSGRSYAGQSKTDVTTKRVKQGKRKQSVQRRSSQRNQTPRSSPTSPISYVKPEDRVSWTAVSPPTRDRATMPSPDDPLTLSPSGRPHIWASSRDELYQLIPEFARAQNDIVFGSTETPVVFIEGDSWETERWDGGKTIELWMLREFTRALPDSAFGPDGDSRTRLPWEHATTEMPVMAVSSTPEPWPGVVFEKGLYRFVPESTEDHVALSASRLPAPYSRPLAAMGAPQVADWIVQAPTDGPSEIEALLLAKTAGMPVSIILCRNATLAPFSLPEGCGCAFLGFFNIVDVQVQTQEFSRDATTQGDRVITLLHGQKAWHFRFEWTPGGEDVDCVTGPDSTPWWMTAGYAPQSLDPSQGTPGVTVQHPYTLLPLRFFAPPAQIVCADADVKAWRGWHCTSCGKLNVQRNLCYQKCNCCSVPNGLPPIAVEYVREVRGTGPVAFPWDRHDPSVECTSTDGPEGLREFTYALGPKGVVHHMFTRNRSEPQAEPTKLFSDLQAEVEFVSEAPGGPGRPGGKGGTPIGPYYSCKYEAYWGPNALWSPEVPSSVSRARELMLRRGRVSYVPHALAINSLTLTAWRTAGHKKGCRLAAKASPVVLLCLGADVELAFWGHPVPGATHRAVSAPFPSTSPSLEPPVEIADDSHMDAEDEHADEEETASAPAQSSSAATSGSAHAKNKGKGHAPGAKQVELLMVTLVHGDLLVVHGAAFEYSIKRTGMSIVLMGEK